MIKLKHLLIALAASAVLLTGCKTTSESGRPEWQGASGPGFPIVFDAAAAGGEVERLFTPVIGQQSSSSDFSANYYRLNLRADGHFLTYWYSQTHPGYAIGLPDMRKSAERLAGGSAYTVMDEGEVPFGPAIGKYIIWSTAGRSCLYLQSSFGSVYEGNRNDFSGKDRLEGLYCAPGIKTVTSDTAAQVGLAVSISKI